MPRLLASEMTVRSFVFATAGRSWYAYRGIDFHMRCVTRGMPPPKDEAHFVLNATNAPEYRMDIKPEEWWRCTDLQSYGQRWKIADWSVSFALRIGVPTMGYTQRLTNAMHMMANLHGIPLGDDTAERVFGLLIKNAQEMAARYKYDVRDQKQRLDFAMRVSEHEGRRQSITYVQPSRL